MRARPWSRPWSLWPAAVAFAALVLGLLAWARPLPPRSGFDQRVFAGAICAGPAEHSVVREPFVRATEQGDGRCVQWAAEMRAPRKMRARVELTSEPGGTVTIDGRLVVADRDAHPARMRAGAIDLAPGIHSFVVEQTSDREGAYLRVGLADELAPRSFELAPPLDSTAFFTNGDAAADALERASFQPVWPAYVGCLALVALSVAVWLALRGRRGKPAPSMDLAIAAALFALAFIVRARGVAAEDDTWDERVYVDAAAHWLRNLALGDFHAAAWRFNPTHPPNLKWALAFGVALGGNPGARVVSATESALAVAFLFAFGRVAFGRTVGAIAGALAVFLPLWVAYGRIAGHESHVLFCWTASMLALACWLRSVGEGARGDAGDGLERGDPLAAFLCAFAATIGLWSKANMVWIFPLLGGVFLWCARRALARGVFALPLAAVGGALAGTGATLAAWPYLWLRPYDALTQLAYMTGPGKPKGDIEVYLGELTVPAWHYFAFAFAAETPALLLALAAAGIAIALGARPSRRSGVVAAMWLVFPFFQSLSTLRVGAGRYVDAAWPALLLFAAIALAALGDLAARGVRSRPSWVRGSLRAAPAAVAVLYVWRALARIEPYPLDYFDEIVGGAAGVAAKRTFEVPWWGEGNLAAVRRLNETAPPGARVRLALWPKHVIARLRDDLVVVPDAASADYVLLSHLQYFEQAPAGCVLESTIAAGGASLVDTYRCGGAGG